MVAVAPQAESPSDATTKPAIQDAFTMTSPPTPAIRHGLLWVTLPPRNRLSIPQWRVCKRTPNDEERPQRSPLSAAAVPNNSAQPMASPSEATGMLKMVSIGVRVPPLPIANVSIAPAPPLST